jgi:hypothetical protein
MALYKALKHTWDYIHSVDYEDFENAFAYTAQRILHVSNGRSEGIEWDGTYFYVTEDWGGFHVYKYNAAWVYQTRFTLHANNVEPSGICWDGTFFYVLDRTDDLVYKYNNAWVYQNTHALHANNVDGRGVEWDGTFFYVVDAVDECVYKYTDAWVYVSTHSFNPDNADGWGVYWDGTYFFVTDTTQLKIYQYDAAWVYQNEYALHANNDTCRGICGDGNNFYIPELDTRIFEYKVGIPISKTMAGHNDSIVLYDGIYEPWAAAHMTGFVEYWFRVKDASEKTNIIFYDGTGNECINIYIDGDILIADGSNILDPALSYRWYRLGIDFDCTPNTYDAYLNGALIVNDEAFAINDDGSGLTGIEIEMDTAAAGHLSGIGYDWDVDYSVGDNADDTVDITADINECTIIEELGFDSSADLKVKGTTIIDFEAGHEIAFYDSDDVLSWTGRILYLEAALEGTDIVGKMRLLGLESQFNNVYRKNFTTARDSDYIIKNIIDNNLTRYHSYDDEIDDFTITYKYDLKTKINKMYKYLSMLERAIIHFKSDGEIFFNKYNNLSASGLSWNQDTANVRITSYTPAANRHVTRVPVIGANNDLGQVYYIGRAIENEEDHYGINELQAWRDSEITNFTEAKQIGDNLQTIYSLDTQMFSMLVVGKKHIQVGYTVEVEWAGVFSITKKDFLVTKRIWKPMTDLCEIELTDNILTRKAFNIKVINKFYDEDAQQCYDESDVPESTMDGVVQPLVSVSELRVAGVGGAHTLASHTSKTHAELTDYNAEANVKHLTNAQVAALHAEYTNAMADARIAAANHDVLQNPNGNANEQHLTAAQITALHTRLHAITDILDHSANNHKIFYSDGAGHIIELALGADGEVLTSTGAATAPAFEAAGGGGISEATLFAYLAVGASNKRWAVCSYDGGKDVYTGGQHSNTGSSNMILAFTAPLPLILNGKNLVITRTKIGIGDADADDYLNAIYIYGFSDHTTLVNLATDNTSRTAAAEITWDHADLTIGGSYEKAYWYLICNNTGSYQLDINYIKMEYYYV